MHFVGKAVNIRTPTRPRKGQRRQPVISALFNCKTRFLIIFGALLAFGCSDDDPVEPPPPPPPTSPMTLNASKDNTLYEDASGAWSNGAGSFFFAGMTAGRFGEPVEARRAVIAFDVPGKIPANSKVDSVFLTLNMSRTVAGSTHVKLHRLQSDWGEGTSFALGNEGGGSASKAGDATWIHTFFDTGFWTTPGGDFISTASDSQLVRGSDIYTWGSTAEMVTDAQFWLDNPASNYGWIIVGDETTDSTAVRFDSRTHQTAANRPKLIVHFTKP